jgi:hypothetical protein
MNDSNFKGSRWLSRPSVCRGRIETRGYKVNSFFLITSSGLGLPGLSVRMGDMAEKHRLLDRRPLYKQKGCPHHWTAREMCKMILSTNPSLP